VGVKILRALFDREGAVSTRAIGAEVIELAQLLSTKSKQKDDFLDHCIHEHSIENATFLTAFMDAKHYWQVSERCVGFSSGLNSFSEAWR
jgi:hypothetical protein